MYGYRHPSDRDRYLIELLLLFSTVYFFRLTQSLVYTFNIRIDTPNIKGIILVMIERRGYLDHAKKAITRSPIVALLGPDNAVRRP